MQGKQSGQGAVSAVSEMPDGLEEQAHELFLANLDQRASDDSYHPDQLHRAAETVTQTSRQQQGAPADQGSQRCPYIPSPASNGEQAGEQSPQKESEQEAHVDVKQDGCADPQGADLQAQGAVTPVGDDAAHEAAGSASNVIATGEAELCRQHVGCTEEAVGRETEASPCVDADVGGSVAAAGNDAREDAGAFVEHVKKQTEGSEVQADGAPSAKVTGEEGSSSIEKPEETKGQGEEVKESTFKSRRNLRLAKPPDAPPPPQVVAAVAPAPSKKTAHADGKKSQESASSTAEGKRGSGSAKERERPHVKPGGSRQTRKVGDAEGAGASNVPQLKLDDGARDMANSNSLHSPTAASKARYLISTCAVQAPGLIMLDSMPFAVSALTLDAVSRRD